ncbi:MAG: alpha/beta hydrolase [Cyclobacteriaceae bacterium]|nr:alpha/beta hydrolase [Cyclobacteriaceae bacterium]UYN87087.1 MAG: alpha/beta hydrolase [Cyclobacteriaceae bacterium]
MAAIHYTEKGNGFTIVLLHGFCENLHIWDSLIPQLSKEFRVITIDLPGFGKSKGLPASHSIDDVADVVLDFISNDRKLEACMVLGHSLGGYVMLAMAEKRPDIFSGIGLLHSTANADLPERRVARNRVIDFVKENGVAAFVQSFIPPLFADQANPAIAGTVEFALGTPLSTLISYTAAMRDRPDRNHVLKSYTKPVLFVAGKYDSLIPVESIETQARQAVKAQIVVLEKSAHMAMLEQTNDTATAILSFVRPLAGHP